MHSVRCPHCHAELPERGRFCVMCGRRIEGWGGLLAAPAPEVAAGPAVPSELPSQYERTRPSPAPKDLLRNTAEGLDEEAGRPTREMPSIGHEMRGKAPDHRVHTSPTGHHLPAELLQTLSAPQGRVVVAARAPAGARPAPGEGVPSAPLPDDHTDVIRVARRAPPGSSAHVLVLSLLCGSVAVVVGLLAYRLLTRLPEEVAPPPAVAAAAPQMSLPAPAPGPGAATHKGLPGVHRTRDLVVSVPASKLLAPVRGRAPMRPVALPPSGPASTTTLDHPAPGPAAPAPGPSSSSSSLAPPADPAGPAPAPVAVQPPPQPLTPEEQRQEAEAQLAASDIEFVASNHNLQVRQCHDRAFKDVPGGSPGGKVELVFTLSEEGRAVDISTAVNTTSSERLSRCLEQRVAEWRFPRPVGGAKAYQFPFVFMAAPSQDAAGAP